MFLHLGLGIAVEILLVAQPQKIGTKKPDPTQEGKPQMHIKNEAIDVLIFYAFELHPNKQG